MANIFETEEMNKMYILRMVNDYEDVTILDVAFDLETVLNERNEHINAIVDKQFHKFRIFQSSGGKEWVKTITICNRERDESRTFEILEGVFQEL